MKLIIFIMILSLTSFIEAGPIGKLKTKLDKINQKMEFFKQAVDNNYTNITKTNKIVDDAVAQLKKSQGDIKILELKVEKQENKSKEIDEKMQKLSSSVNALLSKLDITGQFRLRYNASANMNDFNSDQSDANSFVLQRARLNLKIRPWKDTQFYFQLQHSGIWGSTGEGLPDNPEWFGFHQAYYHVNNLFIPKLSLDLGRMIFSYGSERILGANDFQSVGNAFDGFRFSYQGIKDIKIDALFSLLHESGNSSLGNEIKSDYILTGLYSTFSFAKNIPFDVYFLYVHDGSDSTYKSIAMFGSLLKATLFDVLYFEGEATLQYGKKAEPIFYKKNEHLAVMYYAELAYLLKTVVKAKFSIFTYIASGDAEPTDDKSVQYVTLFPSIDKFLGSMDIFIGTNIKNFGAKICLRYNNINAKIAYNEFYTYDNAGPLPLFGRTNRPPLKHMDSHIGREFDFIFNYITNKYISLSAGYSLFLPSQGTEDYKGLKGAPLGTKWNADAAHFFYLQGKFKF